MPDCDQSAETNVRTQGDHAWLLSPPDQAGEIRLYCLPPAGGGAATYRTWPESLPVGIAVYRVQPPGRETRFREPFCTNLEQYIRVLVGLIEEQPEVPFALFGHSMGALLAYEAAHRLREETGREPSHLFVSAFASPASGLPPPIHRLPDDQFIEQLRTRYGAIRDEILEHPEILELMLPIVRADLALLSTYRYRERPLLDCPVTAVGGTRDPWVTERGLGEWRGMTRGAFALHMLPGGHFYIDSAAGRVAGIVAASLLPAKANPACRGVGA
jgi:surfactin synthase thioesterase subunit